MWASSIWQALQATLFTWGVTAAGSACVFFIPEDDRRVRKILDALLGVASGVMTAASFFSLLAPALEFASKSPLWQRMPVVPVVGGFLLGGGAMFYVDHLLEGMGLCGEPLDLMRTDKVKMDESAHSGRVASDDAAMSPAGSVRDSLARRPRQSVANSSTNQHGNSPRGGAVSALTSPSSPMGRTTSDMERGPLSPPKQPPKLDHQTHRRGAGGAAGDVGGGGGGAVDKEKWRRIYLLVIAITLHNLPEGIAVGVGYGSAGVMQTAAATALTASLPGAAEAAAAEEAARKGYAGARSLAVGIALQNFPEGLAVSLPLRREGMSAWRAFWWGQLSGIVEPIGGILGAALVAVAQPVLPLAMAFAAGAMLFVVVDQLVPEAHSGSPRHATAGFVGGFALMMAMDVAL